MVAAVGFHLPVEVVAHSGWYLTRLVYAKGIYTAEAMSRYGNQR
jgi:hypothetical protein